LNSNNENRVSLLKRIEGIVLQKGGEEIFQIDRKGKLPKKGGEILQITGGLTSK
jgi:hypothetical protein